MSPQYPRSRYLPHYKNTKIFIQESGPGRQRELRALEGTDHIYERIVERHRLLNACDFVTIVDAYKKTPVGDDGGSE